MSEKSETYLAGYNCGFTKPDTQNRNHKHFATKALMEEWSRGKADGERDKAIKEKEKTISVIHQSNPSCPNCESNDIQERSGYQTCFKCGHMF